MKLSKMTAERRRELGGLLREKAEYMEYSIFAWETWDGEEMTTEEFKALPTLFRVNVDVVDF